MHPTCKKHGGLTMRLRYVTASEWVFKCPACEIEDRRAGADVEKNFEEGTREFRIKRI